MMRRKLILYFCIIFSCCTFAQQAIVPAGLNMSGSAGSASVSVGQIHYITLPQVQAGVQQWYNLLYLITTNGTNGTITGGGEYAANASAILSATPADCYTFARWSDGNTSNPRTVTVTGDATYTAIFEEAAITISTAPNVAEGGTTEATVFVEGSLDGVFSVSATKKSYFPRGTSSIRLAQKFGALLIINMM